MKSRSLLPLILLCLVGLVAASAFAQDNDATPPPPPDHARAHGQFDPTKRAEMLAKRLTLSSDQQAKVLELFKSEQSQMESLHSDSSLAQDDRRSKMMDIRKSTNDQVRAVLNSDQQKKFDEMQSRREQWQGHHPDGQMPPPPPDSSNQ